MKSQLRLLRLLVPTAILGIACGRGSDPMHNPYEVCCGNTPVEFSIPGSGAHIYAPNVFTPNYDGINDFFLPFSNEFIVFLNYMVISQDPDDGPAVLYQVQNIAIEDAWPDKAWDGRNEEGELHKGKFTYEISFETIDDQTILIHGSACSIVCDDDAQIFNTLSNCFYSSQNSLGHLDTNIHNRENDCF